VKEIVFISFHPLTNGILNNYCISELIGKGVSVKYYYLRNIYKNFNLVSGQVKSNIIVSLDNFKELNTVIKNSSKNTKYILLLHMELKTLPVYLILSRNKSFMIFLAWGQFFFRPKSKQNFLKKIKNMYKKIFYYIVNKIVLKIVDLLHLVKPFDLVFASGSVATNNYQNHKKIQQFNYFDYDTYLKSKDTLIESKSYIVFLDINLPYHSDQKALGIKPIEPEIYYSSMNKYFDEIEKKTSMKVIIAAHPKSQYDKNVYGGREIIINETNNLVKNSSIVLTHTSSSFVFAVLHNKPIIFLLSDEIERVYPEIIVNPVEYLTSQLGCLLTNIDHDNLSYSDIQIDKEKYDLFKYNFITSKESENKFNYEIFLETLEDI